MAASGTGRTALVTGGGRGIGREIALGLAEDGADVAISYRRDEESALATVAEIEALGRRAASRALLVVLLRCSQLTPWPDRGSRASTRLG